MSTAKRNTVIQRPVGLRPIGSLRPGDRVQHDVEAGRPMPGVRRGIAFFPKKRANLALRSQGERQQEDRKPHDPP